MSVQVKYRTPVCHSQRNNHVCHFTVSAPAAASAGSPEPSKFPVVREIQNIGGQGSTLISYDIDPKGRVQNCVVIESSGSAYLDDAACKGLTEKAKFRPARTDKGAPVAVIGRKTRVRWVIEE